MGKVFFLRKIRFSVVYSFVEKNNYEIRLKIRALTVFYTSHSEKKIGQRLFRQNFPRL